MTKTGAIFDMDGLLLDTERLYIKAMEQAARRFGVPHTQELEDALAGTNGAQAEAVLRRFFPSVDAAALLKACNDQVWEWLAEQVPLKPGARELPLFLRERGIRTAVASSTAKDLVLRNLRLAGILDCFDAVVSGQEVEHGKPAPDIFLTAAERIGCAPEDCYVFEDGINGALAGLAAGCATVMIPDLFQPTEELRKNCAGIFKSLSEAREAVERGKL